MPPYRSRTSTHGRFKTWPAQPAAIWRATRHEGRRFRLKPIIAIANYFTQFVPGHVHLKDLCQFVAREV